MIGSTSSRYSGRLVTLGADLDGDVPAVLVEEVEALLEAGEDHVVHERTSRHR